MNITELINEKTAEIFAEKTQRKKRSPAAAAGKFAKKLRGLQKVCRRISGKAEKSPAEEWLSDNWYLLVREGKTVLRELKTVRKDKLCPMKVLFVGELPALSRIFDSVFGIGSPVSVTEENLTLILETASEEMELGYSENRFAPIALRICLINNAFAFFLEGKGGMDDLLSASKVRKTILT